MRSDLDLTNLLCAASVKHLHQTMEALPVGLIVIDENGAIKSVDEFSAQLLGYGICELKGKDIGTIFGDCCAKIKAGKATYIGKCTITAKSRLKLTVETAIAHGPEEHVFRMHVVYSFDDL